MNKDFTSCIKTGISFKDYVLRCSRACGALVDMVEAPADAEIPDVVEPMVKEYQKAIKRFEDKLAYFESLKGEALIKEHETYLKIMTEENKKGKKAAAHAERAYNNMLKQVEKWNPPTEDHEDLKSFMIAQIRQGIGRDTGFVGEKIIKNRDKWIVDLISHYKKGIAHLKSQMQNEIELAEKRTKWVQTLKESLKKKHLKVVK